MYKYSFIVINNGWGPPSLLSDVYTRGSICGVKWLGMKLITHLHLVQRLRIHGAVTSLTHTPSWHAT